MRFHVLLNSLFKVLFNFPSRYLSSIGLASVLSLRWSLPPNLGCNLKQPDSSETHTGDAERQYGPCTLCGKEATVKRTWAFDARRRNTLLNTTVPAGLWRGGFGAGLVPVHSPLLGES